MVVFFPSGLRPCQDFFTKVEGLGGRTREGRVLAPGRGSERKCAVFEGKQKGERPIS